MTLQPVACYRCGRVGSVYFISDVVNPSRESGVWRCGAPRSCKQRQAENAFALWATVAEAQGWPPRSDRVVMTDCYRADTGPLAVAGVQSRLSP